MTARILEVEPTASVVVVDRALVALHGFGETRDSSLLHAGEDLVELILADQERVVLAGGISVGVCKVERDVIAGWHDEEMPNGWGAGRPRISDEKRGRFVFVASSDDGVVR